MRISKIILLILIILTLLGSASADLTTDLTSYYSFDVDASDDHGTNDGTVTGATWSSERDGSYSFDGDGDYITTINRPTNMTISIWFKLNGVAIGNDYLLITDYRWQCIHQASFGGRIFCNSKNDAGADETTWSYIYNSDPIFLSSWHHFVITQEYHNATKWNATFYLDGIENENKFWTIDTQAIPIKLSNSGTNAFNGTIDEVGVWSRALTSTEVSELYNSGDGLAYPLTVPNVAPVVIVNTPFNNTHTSEEDVYFSYNISDDDGDTLACGLYINGSLNTTNTGLMGVNDSFTVTLSDDEYSWYINCTDSTDNTITDTYTLIIDTVNPLYTELELSTDNSSVYSLQLYDNISFSGYWSDKYMFAWNATITAPNGSLVHNSNATGLTGVKEWVNYTKEITDWNTGTYVMTTCGSDDHTALRWSPDSVVVTNQDITFYKDGDWVKIENNQGNLKSIDYDCSRNDRCGFSFEPNNNRRRWNFEISSNKKLYDRSELYEYPTFVLGDFWLDFVTNSESVSSLHIDQVNDYDAVIRIEMNNNNQERIMFESIGGLNTACESYSFSITNTINLYLNNAYLLIKKTS